MTGLKSGLARLTPEELEALQNASAKRPGNAKAAKLGWAKSALGCTRQQHPESAPNAKDECRPAG